MRETAASRAAPTRAERSGHSIATLARTSHSLALSTCSLSRGHSLIFPPLTYSSCGSGNCTEEDKQKSRESGQVGFWEKPVPASEELLQEISRAWAKAR